MRHVPLLQVNDPKPKRLTCGGAYTGVREESDCMGSLRWVLEASVGSTLVVRGERPRNATDWNRWVFCEG